MEQYYGQELATAYNKWLDGFSSVCTDPVRQGDICKKEVREVRCATLIVHGDQDAIVPISQIEFLQNNFQNSQCENHNRRKAYLALEILHKIQQNCR